MMSDSPATDLESVTSYDNGENFSLSEFFRSEAPTLLGRVKPFSDYFRDSRAKGLAHYGREILSAVSNRVYVRGIDGTTSEMVMFGSNNYLGLTTHPHVLGRIRQALEDFGAGVGGPPLLGGTTQLHKELEHRLSIWKGSEDSLLYGSGYQANLGWVTTLLRDDDVLLYDEYNHASLYDGIALTAATTNLKAIRFAHNDTTHLERLLIRARKGAAQLNRQIFVVTEGVYSMDGDLAPLPRISELCAQYGATLVVDDAHGTGVMGKTGRGTSEHFNMQGGIDICMGSFSKAFGMTGGFLSADREVIDYLRFCSRSYMFSAHLPITTVAGVLGGMEVIEREPERIVRLHENADYLEAGLRALGFQTFREASIIPVRIPVGVNIREVCKQFDDAGIFLNSIEYPAVKKDGQRLRLSVMSTHTRQELDMAIAAFDQIGRRTGIIPAVTV
jgi:8-amino-7-oxononanoate synthase